MLRAMGFPGLYVQGPNALGGLGRLLDEMGFKRPVVLCDAIVAERVWGQVSRSLGAAGIEPAQLVFPGECTAEVIHELSDLARALAPDVVVGLGGGKTIDSAKGIARSLDLQVVVCPTVASNDAPTSRLIVLYDDSHRLVAVEQMRRNPAAVIADTRVIAQAPARFFAAGIGDAVSKKFEAAQCRNAGANNFFGTPPLNTTLMMANAVYDTLVAHGPRAHQSILNGVLDDEVETVVEATVLLSGVGFESGGLSLAHALIRGLTAVPTMAAMLHGELVAFGTLVQLMVEGRPQSEVQELVVLLCAVGLPVTFKQLGEVDPLSADAMTTVVDVTMATAYTKNMSPPLTAERLRDALIAANQFGAMHLDSCRASTSQGSMKLRAGDAP
jgi:glycerol dehydrogenase